MQKFAHWVAVGGLVGIIVTGTATALMRLMNNPWEHRARTSRVLAELRVVATAIEVYRKDHGDYPSQAGNGAILTTPISYLNNLIPDTFSNDGSVFGYYTDGLSYLIFSRGPNGVFEIDPQQDLPLGEERLLFKAYDATNGSVSYGDIYRFGNINHASSRLLLDSETTAALFKTSVQTSS